MCSVALQSASLPSRTMGLLTVALTIVRHGETQYNKDGLLQGHRINPSLSEVGFQQAEAVGRYLKDVTFTNVFVSDMLRARQTAEAIIKHNSSCCGLEVVYDSLLREKSFGVAEGGLVTEYREMAAAAGLAPLDFVPPGGESEQQVTERFKLFLDAMLCRLDADHWLNRPEPLSSAPEPEPEAEGSSPVGRADDGLGCVAVHALVVGHGAYIRAAVRHLLRELGCTVPPGYEEARMLTLSPNTGVSRFLLALARDPGRLAVKSARCVFIHRADHLE